MTCTVCVPFFNPLYVTGDLQSLNGLLSIAHTNVRLLALFPGSLPVNVMRAAWADLITFTLRIFAVGGRSEKTAVTDWALDIVTMHVALVKPEHGLPGGCAQP